MDAADTSSDRAVTIARLRAQAARVRAIARSVAHDEAAPKLHAFAAELESQAEALAARNDRSAALDPC